MYLIKPHACNVDTVHVQGDNDSDSFINEVVHSISVLSTFRYVSCVLGCPYEGNVKPEAVAKVIMIMIVIMIDNNFIDDCYTLSFVSSSVLTAQNNRHKNERDKNC